MSRKPDVIFRMGYCQATIWSNDTRKGKIYNTTIKKSYKDDSGQWKTSDSFGPADIANVALLAQMAFGWISNEYSNKGGKKKEEKKEDNYDNEFDHDIPY